MAEKTFAEWNFRGFFYSAKVSCLTVYVTCSSGENFTKYQVESVRKSVSWLNLILTLDFPSWHFLNLILSIKNSDTFSQESIRRKCQFKVSTEKSQSSLNCLQTALWRSAPDRCFGRICTENPGYPSAIQEKAAALRHRRQSRISPLTVDGDDHEKFKGRIQETDHPLLSGKLIG